MSAEPNQAPDTPDAQVTASELLDDAVVNRAGHRTVVDHIFFQASREVSHEQSQAIARIAISMLMASILLGNAIINNFNVSSATNLALALGYGSYGILHLWWVRHYPTRFLNRRYFVITGDLLLTSYITYQFGLVGLGFYPLYLWIMIGNGLRFGPHYLRVATVVDITGFMVTNWLSGILFLYPGLVIGMLVGLVLMPKFFPIMIRRLAEANLALKEQKEEAVHLAQHDVLTGLPNRALLEDRLTQAIAMATRKGTQVAVLFIDLDGFKVINSNYGHESGDLLLRQIAECLKANVRLSDTVARLGGDEFIILVEDARGTDEVAAIVEQLFCCSGRYYPLGQHRAYTTWSCGVAIYPQDGSDSQTLIKNADTAMYRAKEAGSNRFRLYDTTMSDEVAAQLRRRDEVRRAIEQDQFDVLYQPQFRTSDRRIVGAETLLRWRHPQRGLMPASEFIPVAERSGLIHELGRIGMEAAFRQAPKWHQERSDEFKLFINVSPSQLYSSEFPSQMMKLLAKNQLPSDALGIEITEGVFLEESPKVSALFETLALQGIRLALNDFGTGYSSLGYLKRFRIDRSFVAGLPDDPDSCKLVEAILDIAKHLEIDVLLKGVDTEQQLAWLSERRCQLVQGNLLSPPLSAEEFSDLLRQQ